MRGYAALPANEGETVFDWIRRQNNPVKPPKPASWKGQPAGKETGRAGTRPVENDSRERNQT